MPPDNPDNPGGRGGCAVLFLRSNSSRINQKGKCSVLVSCTSFALCCFLSCSFLMGYFQGPSQLSQASSLHVGSLEIRCRYLVLWQIVFFWRVSGYFVLCYPSTGQGLIPRIFGGFSEPQYQWSAKVNFLSANLL